MTSKRQFVARLAAASVAVGVLAPLMPGQAAGADSVGEEQARAAGIAAQIDAAGLRESSLAEQYDAAMIAEQDAAQQVAAAQSRAAAADGRLAAARSTLSQVATDAYTNTGAAAPPGGSTHALDDAQSELVRSEYTAVFAGKQTDVVDQYRTAKAEAVQATARLVNVEHQAATQLAAVGAAKQAVTRSESQLQATYAQVNGQLAVLVAAAEAARQAEQARQAQLRISQLRLTAQHEAEVRAQQATIAAAQVQASTARTPTAVPAPNVPTVASPTRTVPTLPAAGPLELPTETSVPASGSAGSTTSSVPSGSGGAAAVAAAMSRVGDPYVWGATGPSTFDCSGLTMWAWAHAGVSLPHFSGAQYATTAHIPMSDLQPGDLVFFADPGEHMAMYIGGGQIVEAPHSGAVVRVVPLYSQYVLASRP